MIRLDVRSETRPLGGVIIHRPGQEHARITPHMLPEALIEDILDPDRAAGEHDEFTDCLKQLGVKVFSVSEMLTDILKVGDREELVSGIVGNSGIDYGSLTHLSPEQLTEFLITGYCPSVGQKFCPLCNLTFTRDPFFVIGSVAYISNPKEPIRKRESAIMETIFRNHPDLANTTCVSARDWSWPIEGGDILVINKDVVVIGGEHRTHPRAAEELAERLLKSGFKTVFRVAFHENGRRTMHIDTAITPISDTEAIVFPPVMLGNTAEQATSVLVSRMVKGEGLCWKRVPTLLEGLEGVGVKFDPIPCGGDLISQQRDQWNDGCNAFAVSPGVIFSYDRCQATIVELEKHGYTAVQARDVHEMPSVKTVILLPSNELPKARGGWRCMSMPLWRN